MSSVKTSRCRKTGTNVTVGRAEDLGLDPGETPWFTVCEEHNTCCGHDTGALARSHAADPTLWCEECPDSDEL